MPEDPVDRVVDAWAAVHPDLDTLPMAIIGRVHRISAAAADRVTAHFADHNLSRGDYDVLASLRRAGDPPRLTPGQLQKALLLSSAGITGRVDRLERSGLVRRLPDEQDGRVVRVELTDEGRDLVDRVVHEDMERQGAWLSGLSENERKVTLRVLRRLLKVVECDEPG